MNNLKEVTEKLAALGKKISQIYEEAGEDLDFTKVKCLEGDTQAKVDALKAIDTEVTELKAEREQLIEVEKALKGGKELNEEMNNPAAVMTFPGKGDPKVATKSLGELFMESKAFKDKGREAIVDIDLKATMTAAAGWDPEALRIPRVELYPVRPIAVVDYFPILPTVRDTIKYMKETTFTATAVVEKAENTAFGEAALALTETSDEVEKIPVFLPVTDEQLEDVSGLAAYINARLTYMLRARLDYQLLNGTGVTPLLLGTANLAAIQTQPKGADPTPDAIYKAMTKVRSIGFAEPSGVFLNPNDWQDIRLLRTADGIYIFGSPMDAGPERIWGVPVCVSTAVVEDTGILGDYRGYAALFMRRGITFKISDSHAALFVSGVQCIRADMRCAVVHFRDTAFCTVTGI